MKAPARKADPPAPPSARRPLSPSLSRAVSAPAAGERTPPASRFSPAVLAQRAVALKPTTPSGHSVKLTVTLLLSREVAEWITERAIRERRNVPGLIGELLTREAMGKRAS